MDVFIHEETGLRWSDSVIELALAVISARALCQAEPEIWPGVPGQFARLRKGSRTSSGFCFSGAPRREEIELFPRPDRRRRSDKRFHFGRFHQLIEDWPLHRAAPDNPGEMRNGLVGARFCQKYLLRQIIATCTEYAARAYDEQGEVQVLLNEVEKNVLRIGRDRFSGTTKTIKSLAIGALESVERLYENRRSLTGLATGFKDLDDITNGLQRGELIVIAARPSMHITKSLGRNSRAGIKSGIALGIAGTFPNGNISLAAL